MNGDDCAEKRMKEFNMLRVANSAYASPAEPGVPDIATKLSSHNFFQNQKTQWKNLFFYPDDSEMTSNGLKKSKVACTLIIG